MSVLNASNLEELHYDFSPVVDETIQNIQTVLTPLTGATFGPSSLIKFQLPTEGFIDPKSLFIRYHYNITNTRVGGNPAAAAMLAGCPAAMPFVTLREYFNGQYHQIPQYNQVYSMLVNITYDVAEKYGHPEFGYSDNTNTPSMQALDGRVLGTDESGSFAFPVISLLSNCDKLIPAFITPVIYELQVDTIANIFSSLVGTYTVPTAFTISNIELVYNKLYFGPAIEQQILSRPTPLYIRSHSFNNISSTSLATGASGNISIPFSFNHMSMKSIFFLFQSTDNTVGVNQQYDSFDPTGGSGEIQVYVNSLYYPRGRPLSTLYNKNGILMELKKAIGDIQDESNAPSINYSEWNRVASAATTLAIPGKFIVGISTSKLSSSFDNPTTLNGISTNNGLVRLNMNFSTATPTDFTINAITNYDVLLVIDPVSKQITINS